MHCLLSSFPVLCKLIMYHLLDPEDEIFGDQIILSCGDDNNDNELAKATHQTIRQMKKREAEYGSE